MSLALTMDKNRREKKELVKDVRLNRCVYHLSLPTSHLRPLWNAVMGGQRSESLRAKKAGEGSPVHERLKGTSGRWKTDGREELTWQKGRNNVLMLCQQGRHSTKPLEDSDLQSSRYHGELEASCRLQMGDRPTVFVRSAWSLDCLPLHTEICTLVFWLGRRSSGLGHFRNNAERKRVVVGIKMGTKWTPAPSSPFPCSAHRVPAAMIWGFFPRDKTHTATWTCPSVEATGPQALWFTYLELLAIILVPCSGTWMGSQGLPNIWGKSPKQTQEKRKEIMQGREDN